MGPQTCLVSGSCKAPQIPSGRPSFTQPQTLIWQDSLPRAPEILLALPETGQTGVGQREPASLSHHSLAASSLSTCVNTARCQPSDSWRDKAPGVVVLRGSAEAREWYRPVVTGQQAFSPHLIGTHPPPVITSWGPRAPSWLPTRLPFPVKPLAFRTLHFAHPWTQQVPPTYHDIWTRRGSSPNYHVLPPLSNLQLAQELKLHSRGVNS